MLLQTVKDSSFSGMGTGNKSENCSPQQFLPSGEVFLHMQSPQHGAGLSLL